MTYLKFLIMALIFVMFTPHSYAKNSDLWEKAFAHPRGATLVEEVNYEPEKFLILNQGKKVRIAGKYLDTEISSNASKSYSMIVWGSRFKGVSCNSINKNNMINAMNLVKGSEVIASGTVKKLSQGWLHLEECIIKGGVTLFHQRDPKLILGSWCGFFRKDLSRKLIFSQNEKREYIRRTFEYNNGQWSEWSISPMIVKLRRSPTNIVAYRDGAILSDKKYHIKNHSTFFSEDHIYKRCK